MKIKNFGKLALMLPIVTVTHAEELPQVLDDVEVSAEASELTNWLTFDSKTKPVQELTKIGQLTKSAPLAGSIIDQEELETVKYVDLLREQFNRIPGVSQTRNFRIPDGGKPYTLGLVDGLMYGSPQNQNSTGSDQFNPQEIERMEIVRGPGSVLYPSNGIAGQINLITKDPSKRPEYWLSQEIGSYDFYRTQGSASGMITPDLGYTAGFTNLDYNPWKDRNGAQRGGASGKLVYRPDDVSKLTLRLEHMDWYAEDASSLTKQQFDSNWQQANPGMKNLYQDFEYLTGVASYKRKIGKDGELEFSFSRREQNGIDANPGGGSSASSTSQNHVDNAYNNAHSVYRQDFDLFKSRVYTGLDIIDGYQNVQKWSRPANRFNAIKMTEKSQFNDTQIAPFIQYEFSPLNGVFGGNNLLSAFDRLRFNFGLRHEEYQQQTDVMTVATGAVKGGENTYKRLIKKGGLSFEYIDDHILWFGMADGWLVPGTAQTITAAYPNNGVLPETSITKQLGLRGYFRDQKLSYDITAYESNINNYIGSVLCSDNIASCPGWNSRLPSANTLSFSSNPGAVTARGFETALSYRPHDLIKFDVAHTLVWNTWDKYVSGATKLSDVTLASTPKHKVNGRVTLFPIHNWNVEFEADYISSYYTNVQNTDSYQRPMLFNMRTSYKWQNWTVSLQALNLLDTKYASRVSANAANVQSYSGLAGIGDGPFTVRAGVQYAF
jgi:outer membrane receptor protein involved in Fe transport